jgi:hypothetical protein
VLLVLSAADGNVDNNEWLNCLLKNALYMQLCCAKHILFQVDFDKSFDAIYDNDALASFFLSKED